MREGKEIRDAIKVIIIKYIVVGGSKTDS